MALPHSGRPDTGPPTNFDIWIPERAPAKTIVDARHAALVVDQDKQKAEWAKVLPAPAQPPVGPAPAPDPVVADEPVVDDAPVDADA